MFIGHKHLKDYFKIIKERETFHNAYIFTGNEGVGKKLFALNLAKSVHCLNDKYFEECHCNSCLQINENIYPDVILLQEDELSIDNIRELSEKAFLSSFSGKRKFFILDNFHKIKREAANAMLKTLEEPPIDTTFILITHNYDMVLPTIRSRCIKIVFHRLSKEELTQINKDVDTFEPFIDILNCELFDIINEINKINDRDEFSTILENTFKYSKKLALEKENIKLGSFSDYLLDILKSVDYNINLDIAKGYLITKIIEVKSD
ncbi:AAA family ATPase [Deferribacter thermophilus]|uniref:DNA polymerase III subunit n=1 Tax=Deferribacter thermophilus TaxID=53573 RepID=UPI003C24E4EB